MQFLIFGDQFTPVAAFMQPANDGLWSQMTTRQLSGMHADEETGPARRQRAFGPFEHVELRAFDVDLDDVRGKVQPARLLVDSRDRRARLEEPVGGQDSVRSVGHARANEESSLADAAAAAHRT